MIYQFEYDEIKSCRNCPCHSFIDVPYDNEWCDLQDASINSDGRPKENNCPLAAISKTETTTPTTLTDKVKAMAHCAIDAGIIDAVDWSAEIIRRLEENK